MVKNQLANAEDLRDAGSIPGSGRSPGEGNTPVLLPGEFHGKRSLAGYSPQSHKESDMTEHSCNIEEYCFPKMPCVRASTG